MYFDLIQKKFLIVDEFSQFEADSKKMIESMGVHQVDGVKSGECAIQQMQENAYDVILCVYNLGQGKKDGQQMIEKFNILIFLHIQP